MKNWQEITIFFVNSAHNTLREFKGSSNLGGATISLLSLSTWTNDVLEGIVYYPDLRGTQRGVVPTIPPTWKKSIIFV